MNQSVVWFFAVIEGTETIFDDRGRFRQKAQWHFTRRAELSAAFIGSGRAYD